MLDQPLRTATNHTGVTCTLTHCSAVSWQCRAHFAHLLLLGLLRCCDSSTQSEVCQSLWDHISHSLSTTSKCGSADPLAERRWKCAQHTFRGVLLIADPANQVYLVKKLWSEAATVPADVGGVSGARVDAVCELLADLPLAALFATNHDEVQRVTRQLIEASLGSVLETDSSATSTTSSAVLRRECAVSVLAALSSEGAENRLSDEPHPLLEQVLGRLVADVSVGTCVVNWLNVLNEYQFQLCAKLGNASTRVVQRRRSRLGAVLSVVYSLLRLLSAHKLPKGVVGVLVECAVCTANSAGLLWAKGTSRDSGVSEVVAGLKAAVLAVRLTATSAGLSSDQAKVVLL